ncbi:diguanylate cyclase [Hahella aquimaris]|uniref:diguanylate cyclase n=1 Tax=Hahella sp. HNIBRBA332 TaxID=3015983 RepID=UPI00273C119A|nr:diguanylate cyclase [Hahella sp. HNIBRBA332]WLQ16642.1 diguanylate cyclase [Hahella sp. HNIBRBA332]
MKSPTLSKKEIETTGQQTGMQVLLVDDDFFFREYISLLLEDAGHKVLKAASAEEGLHILKTHPCSIILTDWMMPAFSGLDFCMQVRRWEQGYHYIILLTGKETSAEVVEGLSAGADDFIKKSASPSEVMARVKCGARIIQQHRKLEEQKEKIAQLAERDPLTNAYNRHFLYTRLPGEIKRSKRYHIELSVIMTDIDHFKRINDGYGHLIGDRALKFFARTLSENLRQNVDWVCRYGGEEFVIVLPNTELDKGVHTAEKLRGILERSVLTTENGELNFTASFGVAALSSLKGVYEMESLLRLADERLYESKNKGRNCVSY